MMDKVLGDSKAIPTGRRGVGESVREECISRSECKVASKSAVLPGGKKRSMMDESPRWKFQQVW